MKKTKKIFALLVISCLICIMACTNTKAHNVELDPKGLIGYPMFIFGGEGTITIDSSETGYKLYFQGVEIQDSIYTEIKNATTTEKRKELIPTYVESNWIEAVDNKFSIDSSKYTGNKAFAVWTKLVSSDNTTSYDVEVYTVSGTKTETDTEKEDANKDNSNNSGNISENENYTDFSKAKIELVQNGRNGYDIQISNVGEKKENHRYKYFIGNGSATPTYKEAKDLSYDKEKNIFLINYAEDYIELADKYYLYIFEATSYTTEEYKIVLEKTEIEKVTLKKYSDAYADISHITYNSTQIIYNMPFGRETNRKMNIKIGKISNQEILKDIQDKKADSFEKLLTYAKEGETIYNNTVVSNKQGAYTTEQSLLDISKLEDDAYYFIYTSFDGENGKFVESECVTFAQADVFKDTNSYFLFLYGSDDFKWNEFSVSSDGKQDTTTALTKIPQTGQNYTVAAVIAAFLIIAFVGSKFIRKNRDIK